MNDRIHAFGAAPRMGPSLARVGLAATAALLLAAPATQATVQSIEAVGTAPVPTRDPRGEALEAAIGEAVLRVAEELLLDSVETIEREQLQAVLGENPRIYTTRFRLREDRGEREALFDDGEGSGREYVVVAAVDVDTDRVREQLVGAQLLDARATGPSTRLRVEVVGLDSHAAYAAFTRAMAQPLGRERIVPAEIERGRALFEVESTMDLDALLRRIQAAAPSELDVVRLAPGRDAERLAVRWSGAR